MKALSLHGPWAVYERKNAENESRIAKLEGEVSYWQQLAEEARAQLSHTQHEMQGLLQQHVPELQDENKRARTIICKLEEELDNVKNNKDDEIQSLSRQLSAVREELARMGADNLFLKQELAKTAQVRHSTNSKLEEARRKLGLSPSEADVFIKDFDEARTTVKLLRQEAAQLSSDKAHLQQQCDSRSQHCMTLIAENKRLIDQVADLRRQVVELEQDGWRLRQELAASQQLKQRVQQKKAVAAAATKERPQWQDLKARPSSKGGSSSQGPAPADRQFGRNISNSTATRDVTTAKPSSTQVASYGLGSGGGLSAVSAAGRSSHQAEIVVPAAPLVERDGDPFNVELLREALALRQQRLMMAVTAAVPGGDAHQG